jgi:hypothetical protein
MEENIIFQINSSSSTTTTYFSFSSDDIINDYMAVWKWWLLMRFRQVVRGENFMVCKKKHTPMLLSFCVDDGGAGRIGKDRKSENYKLFL